jgi:hypothetical protein
VAAFPIRRKTKSVGLPNFNEKGDEMKYFWKILMDVYKFARGIIALLVLMFVSTFIWSMYYVSKNFDEGRHLPAVVVRTAPVSIAAPARVTAPVSLASTVAASSKPDPIQAKSPISLTVKHIGRGSNQFMPDSYVSLVVDLKNDGKKAIKATKGTIVINDAFGEELLRLGVENAKTIHPGQTVKEAGEWPIMFERKAQNGINGESADTSKLTFAFIPKVILFEDGSKFEQ